MAKNFMAASRMITLRVMVNNHDLTLVDWQLVDDFEIVDSGTDVFANVLQMKYSSIEVYLASILCAIFKIDLGNVSDRRINDDLLLNMIEDNLAGDIEDSKPILLRLSDGEAYVAVVDRVIYQGLLAGLSEYVKLVKFIQPVPYLTKYEDNLWTVHLVGEDKFIRTSRYEYYLLDDQLPLPELLESMLRDYTQNKLILYAEDLTVKEVLENKYGIKCELNSDLEYGELTWNFYNEKSKRFNFKPNLLAFSAMKQSVKWITSALVVYTIIWLISLTNTIYHRSALEKDIALNLKSIVKDSSYRANLLADVDGELEALSNAKGLYAPSDMMALLNVFLKIMPDVGNNMMQGIEYQNRQLNIFLNDSFDAKQFDSVKSILKTKRINAQLIDYRSYQQTNNNSKQDNSRGGILSSSGMDTSQATVQNAKWVVSMQIISRIGDLGEKNTN